MDEMELLEEVVREYLANPNDGGREELDRFRAMAFPEAVRLAAMSRQGDDEDSPFYEHQRRIGQYFGRRPFRRAATVLTGRLPHLRRCEHFGELLTEVTESVDGIHGLGVLYAYDVSFRIGANRRIMPRHVYLHAGTRAGALILSTAGHIVPPIRRGERFIERRRLPDCLRQFQCWEIENLLCRFHNWYVNQA